ncbi:hypothetical protein POM88_008382 [Heracleum sosnowskyi]|uniref:RNase H type-1 domain-containing protein n=1 Tax=Heracleum sosnowskyi TaxID=360622 RepID=A0AAD8J7X2_9APIA|nr:hypothetical protein POM88_008382 [Heracleum sosnowskyi]
MWTLWLNRNQIVFNNSKVSLEEVVKLVKVRSREWALARNIILEDAVLWLESNPTGVVTRSRDLKVEKLFKCDCELIVKSGIGGIIKNTEGFTKLIFFGPSAVTVFDSELRAFEELLEIISSDFRKDVRVMCYTDYSDLIISLAKLKDLRGSNIFSESKVLDFFLAANLLVKKIDRIFLQEAYSWAKQGSMRASLLVNRLFSFFSGLGDLNRSLGIGNPKENRKRMEMVNVNATWEMPMRGAVKINVHGFFSENQLENGNRSGIGVVVRNNRGTILRMLGGSLGIDERGNNELYAFLEGLKRAYVEDYPEVILETDHVNTYWE